jgi:hypothetical protein
MSKSTLVESMTRVRNAKKEVAQWYPRFSYTA